VQQHQQCKAFAASARPQAVRPLSEQQLLFTAEDLNHAKQITSRVYGNVIILSAVLLFLALIKVSKTLYFFSLFKTCTVMLAHKHCPLVMLVVDHSELVVPRLDRTIIIHLVLCILY